MKKLIAEIIATVTSLSGVLAVLAGLGWILGAPDGKLLFFIALPIFLIFAAIVYFLRNWLRSVGVVLGVWPF